MQLCDNLDKRLLEDVVGQIVVTHHKHDVSEQLRLSS